VFTPSTLEDLETQIRAYLDQQGSALGLQDALNHTVLPPQGGELIKAEVMVRDVTGDTVPEVIIDASHANLGDLLIFACRAGAYMPLRQPIWGTFYTGLHAVVDMNRPEHRRCL
jgi:hypothetical protein